MPMKSYSTTMNDGHNHSAQLDDAGNGQTSSNGGHSHSVSGFSVSTVDGHSHSIIR